MPAEPHPLISDLQSLTLRAAVALAARCARRVQPILAPKANLLEASQKGIALAEEFSRGIVRQPRVTEAIASVAERYAPPPDREVFPRDPRFDLRHAIGAAREVSKSVAGVSVEDTAFRVMHPPSIPSTEWVLTHSAEAIRQAALVTAITLEWIPIDSTFRLTFEQEYPLHAQETAWAADAIQNDFQALKRLSPGTGVEEGDPIDPSDIGELGPLWPGQAPCWFEDLKHAVRPSRLTVVVPVDARQTALIVKRSRTEVKGLTDVLCLSVGEEQDSFSSTTAVLDWVKEYRSARGGLSVPNLIVLAPAPSDGSAPQEQVIRSELVYQFGAAVLARGSGSGEFPDWVRVQSALPTVPLIRGSGPRTASTLTQLGVPPATARAYGRQPAHSDPYDPVQFEKAVERLNMADWWEVDQ